MRRKLKRGQIYTTQDGSHIWRQIESVQPNRGVWMKHDDDAEARIIGTVSLIYYWTNRGPDLHRCLRHTFIDWLHRHKARKTQKNRRRKL